MRPLATLVCAFLLVSALPHSDAFAQPSREGELRIEWEVKNRFRLFRNEADFQRHVAAHRDDGILAAEARLARESDGRGWARDTVERLCIDRAGRLVEFCQRDNEREVYLAPKDHRVGVMAAGAVPAGATCAWSFDDGEGEPRRAEVPCEEEVRLRVLYGRPTVATVEIVMPDNTALKAGAEIAVRDLLVAGMGDSIAAGEGNPDRGIALEDGGFCFRRFLGSGRSEYFRPGRANYRGDKACGAVSGSGIGAADWFKLGARWMSAPCHASLYGYQTRTAIALAVENPHIAVTYLPLACSGAEIDAGVLNPQTIRECQGASGCGSTVPSQIERLRRALTAVHRSAPNRNLDLVLLTVGANDIKFSGLVANVIVDAPTERLLISRGGEMSTVEQAERTLERALPTNFTKLRAALKPLVGGHLGRVVYVSYGNPALHSGGAVCPGGQFGFDVHPAFNADPERLNEVSQFVSRRFLPRVKDLATCGSGASCRDSSDRMTFVDSHQEAFASHGFCARSDQDPEFDRECFSPEGKTFRTDPAEAAIDPMICQHRATDFRPYATRARWVRTANDSYFTAMTYPEGLSSTLMPSDIHDATWGVMSAVYGGAIHPTAEGHAAMADAAMPAARAVLGLSAAPAVSVEPLAPLQVAPAQ